MRHQPHLALYGQVALPRVYCQVCRGWALVVDGRLVCCERLLDDLPMRTRRMSAPPVDRRRPTTRRQTELLAAFDCRCAYCERAFGSSVQRGGRAQVVRVQWDHAVPFAYAQNNAAHNFLPACQWCNRWKSTLMFRTLDDARVYLLHRWEAWLGKGLWDEK